MLATAPLRSDDMTRQPARQRQLSHLRDIPNIGPATAADLQLIGIDRPSDLLDCDPYELYTRLEAATGTHQDPCVLDVFISAVRFMNGAPARPWWKYTAERKNMLVDKKLRD